MTTADGSMLEADCNMAQAFEIPTETGQRSGDPSGFSFRCHLTSSRMSFPDRRSRPERTQSNRLGNTNMGPDPVRRKRVIPTAWQRPIPGSAIRHKINQSRGI